MPKVMKSFALIGFVLLFTACADQKNDSAVIEAPPRYVTLTPLPTRTPSATPFASPSPTDTPAAVANAVEASAETMTAWHTASTLGNGTIDRAYWTPDGTQLIVSGGNGLQWLSFDPMLDNIQQRLVDYHAPLAFAPDGVTLLAIGPDGSITRLDADLNPAPIRDSVGDWSKLMFAPDGAMLAAFSSSEILLIDAVTYEIKRRLLYDLTVEWPLDMVYGPDGVLLVTLSHIPDPNNFEQVGDYLRVQEAETGVERWSLAGPGAQAARVEFSDDGRYLRVNDPLFDDPSPLSFQFVPATLYDLATFEPLESVTMRGYWSTGFAHDGTRMASQSSNDTWLTIHELPTGRQVAEIPIMGVGRGSNFVAGDNINLALDLQFSPDDSKVALITGARVLFVFDLNVPGQVARWDAFTSPIHSLAFAPEMSQLAVASINGTRLYPLGEVNPDAPPYLPLPQTGRIVSVAYAADGTRVATGSSGDGAILWDAATGEQLSRLNGVDNSQFLAFAPDDTWLIDGGAFFPTGFNAPDALGVIRVWDLTGTTILPKYADVEAMEGMPSAFALAPAGRHLVVATLDPNTNTSRLYVFDPTDGRGLSQLDLGGYTITSLLFSPDGTMVYAGGSDGYVRVFAMGSDTTQIAEYASASASEIRALAIEPNGAFLVTGQTDGTLTWLSLAADNPGTIVYSVADAHLGGVSALALATDGTVASGGMDGLTHLWQLGDEAGVATVGAGEADEPTPAVSDVSDGSDATPVPAAVSSPLVQVAQYGEGALNQVVFYPDSQQLLTVGSANTTAYRLPDLTIATDEIEALRDPVVITHDGDYVIGVNAFGMASDNTGERIVEQIVALPTGDGEPINILTDFSFVRTIALAPDNSALAVVGYVEAGEETIEVYSFPAGKLIQKLGYESEYVGGIHFAAPDELLVALYKLSRQAADPGEAPPVRIVEFFSNEERLSLPFVSVDMLDVIFSPDGSLMHLYGYAFGPSAADGSNSLEPIDEPVLRRVSDGQAVDVPGETAPIFTFSADSRLYAFLSFAEQATIKIVDIEQATTFAEVDLRGSGPRNQFLSPTRALYLSPDNSKLAVLEASGRVALFDVTTGELLTRTAPGAGEAVQAFDISPDGRYVLSGTATDLLVWDTASGNIAFNFFAFGTVSSVEFAPDNQHVALGTLGGNASVWDYTSLLAPPEDSNGGPFFPDTRVGLNGLEYVTAIAFNGDSTRLVTAGYYLRRRDDRNPLIRIWDLTTTPTPLPATADIESLPGVPLAMALSPDDRTLAVATEGGLEILLFDATNSQPIGALVGTINSSIVGLAFASDGNQLMVLYGSGGGTVFDVASQSVHFEWAGTLQPDDQGLLTTFYQTMALSADGTQLAGGRNDGLVTVWDATTGAVISEFQPTDAGITVVKFNAEGQLVIGGQDGIVRVWGHADDAAE